MDINAYINSGVLELYVAGALTDAENKEVHDMMLQYPEIRQEVLEIEDAVVKLTAATSPKATSNIFAKIKEHIIDNCPEVPSEKPVIIPSNQFNWITYSGWAAALILGAGLLWILNQNQTLEQQVSTTKLEKSHLETEIEASKVKLANANTIVDILRNSNLISIPLKGQGAYADTYAKVYWDKDDNSIYLDAKGLPEPPRDKVYQVWSLTLNPLTPVSLGTIDDFSLNDYKLFELANANDSEAFGITLEPAGGSATPTMEQLYTLGTVTAATAP